MATENFPPPAGYTLDDAGRMLLLLPSCAKHGRTPFQGSRTAGHTGYAYLPQAREMIPLSQLSSAGSTVCSTSVALPAVPTEKHYSPGVTFPGINVSSGLPIAAPCTSALLISAAAFTAVRCCLSRPGVLSPCPYVRYLKFSASQHGKRKRAS